MNSPIRPDDAYSSELNAELADSAPEIDAELAPVDGENVAGLDDELDPDDEAIVAYLDDELDPEARAAFERRLADEPKLRARVDAERSAWNALSLLDVAAPNENLPDAVVERLDSEAQAELRELSASLRRRRALRVVLFGSTALLLAALGFCVCSFFFPDLQTRRERDFRVVERLAQLEIVGDFDYLTALDASGLFAPNPPRPASRPTPPRSPGAPRFPGAPDFPGAPNFPGVPNSPGVPNFPGAPNSPRFSNSPESPRPEPPFDRAAPADAQTPPQSFEELSQDRAFYRLQQKFERLDAETQARLRALYRQIVDAPNADELWSLLDRYCAWFSATPSDDERARLLAAPIPERLEIIRRRRDFARRFAERQRDAANRFAPQPTSDAQTVDAGERRADSPQIRAFRDALPAELRDENLEPLGQKYDEFLQAKRDYGGERENALAFLTEESTEKITAAFSDKARDYLNALSEEDRSAALGLLVTLGFWERQERAFQSTRQSTRHFQRNGRENASYFASRPLERDAQRRDFIRELAETLRKLPPERRDFLTSRPADEMRGVLWATHWRNVFRNADRSPRSDASPTSTPSRPPFPAGPRSDDRPTER